MKRYLIVVAALAALLLVVFLSWPRRGDRTNTPVVFEPAPQALGSSNATENAPSGNPQVEQTTAEVGASAMATNQESKRSKAERLSNENWNIPVAFYGLVVDQDTNALQDVTVNLEVLEQYADPFPEVKETVTRLQKQTGAGGRFEVSGLKGHSVTVTGLAKEGYEPERLQKHYGIFGAQSASLEQPVVFMLWSTNLHEQLIRGQKAFEIVPDGRPYLIDLTNGTISESGPGDLRVWIKAPAQMERDQEYDWSCEVDAMSGGLLEQPPGGSMSRAPVEGYVPSFKFQGRLKGGRTGSPGEKYFFVRLKDGQEYGAIRIELLAPYNKRIPGLIRLSYAINPSGSRMLW